MLPKIIPTLAKVEIKIKQKLNPRKIRKIALLKRTKNIERRILYIFMIVATVNFRNSDRKNKNMFCFVFGRLDVKGKGK